MTDTVHSDQSGAPVITINFPEFRLSWNQAWKIITVIGSLIALANASGWLFVPAKQTELVAMQEEVKQIKTAMQGLTDTMGGLTGAVNELRQAVSSRPANAAPTSTPRVKAPPKPKPQSQSPVFPF